MTALLASRQLSRPVAELRSAFAAASMLANLPECADEDRPTLRLEEPLPTYAIVGEYQGSGGTLWLGLEMGAIDPAYAADVITGAARDAAALKSWIDWMLSPWIELLERHLGATFSLRWAKLGSALPEEGLAFQMDSRGNKGHIGVGGTALGRFRWHELLQIEQRVERRSWLKLPVHVLIEAGVFAIREFRVLAPGAVLRLPGLRCLLHVGDLAKGVRVPMSRIDEEEKMDVIEKSDPRPWKLVAMPPEPEAASTLLDDVALQVEVVLDRRLVTLAQVEALQQGAVYQLPSMGPGKSVALCCNGLAFARGELVSVENEWAVLVTDIAGSRP